MVKRYLRRRKSKKKMEKRSDPLGLKDEGFDWDIKQENEVLPPMPPSGSVVIDPVKRGLDEIKLRAESLQKELINKREKLIDELEEVLTLKKEIFDTVGILRDYHLNLTRKEKVLKMIIESIKK